MFGPARATGYRSVWLVGVFLGKLGTVRHEEVLPRSIAGMVPIAPYLGEREALASIEAADGLRALKAPAGQ